MERLSIPISAGVTYTTKTFDTYDFSGCVWSAYGDQPFDISLLWSHDGENFEHVETKSVLASTPFYNESTNRARYLKMTVENTSATDMTEFRGHLKLAQVVENELTIKDSTIVLYKQPFTVKNGTKTYQAADGGFYYFEGGIKKKGDRLIAVLSLNYDRSLYVPIRIDRNNKHVPITEQEISDSNHQLILIHNHRIHRL